VCSKHGGASEEVVWDAVSVVLAAVAIARARRQATGAVVGQFLGVIVGVLASIVCGVYVVPWLEGLSLSWGWVMGIVGQVGVFVPLVYGFQLMGQGLRQWPRLPGPLEICLKRAGGLLAGLGAGVWLGVVVASVPLLRRAGGASVIVAVGEWLLRLPEVQ
jgi:hypothetical protein